MPKPKFEGGGAWRGKRPGQEPWAKEFKGEMTTEEARKAREKAAENNEQCRKKLEEFMSLVGGSRHPKDDFEVRRFPIKEYLKEWRENGVDVEMVMEKILKKKYLEKGHDPEVLTNFAKENGITLNTEDTAIKEAFLTGYKHYFTDRMPPGTEEGFRKIVEERLGIKFKGTDLDMARDEARLEVAEKGGSGLKEARKAIEEE